MSYSRGMHHRLGEVEAMMHRPEVLFLDEPASALDPMGRREMRETMISLKGETTIFLSTHILADIERVCDQVAFVNRGKLVSTGRIDHLHEGRQRSVLEMVFEEDPRPMATRLAGFMAVIGVYLMFIGSIAFFWSGMFTRQLAAEEIALFRWIAQIPLSEIPHTHGYWPVESADGGRTYSEWLMKRAPDGNLPS